MNIFRLIPHRHIWSDTRINPLTYTATEQKCRLCKCFRHHLYSDRFGKYADSNKWREGKFPEKVKPESRTP